MKKKLRNQLITAVSVAGLIGLTVALIRSFSKRKTASQVGNSSSTVIVGSGGGGGTPNPPVTVYNGFSIKKAYLDGSTYRPYVSSDEALDKNLDESLTNQTGTVYATNMNTGNLAYSNANGSDFYATGYYYYPQTGETLFVNPQGVMAFYNDVDKNGLNSQQINDSHS